MLETEFEYFKTHQDELVKEYNGKYIVIRGQEVVGAYSSELAALEDAKKKFDLGTFLIQLVTPGDSSYTQTFHSRVSIV
jgi:Family of unknown function (DUF5678)